MANLKDNAITLLGSLAATSVATGAGPTTIFTTPAGKVTRITHIIVYNPSGSCATATDLKFGTGFRNNVAVSIAALTTANTGFMVLNNTAAAGDDLMAIEIAAGTTVQVTVATGAAGVTASFDVFGFTKAS